MRASYTVKLHQERDRFTQVLREESADPETAAALAPAIFRTATTLDRLYTEACNGPGWDADNATLERWQTRLERKTERVEARIPRYAKALGVSFALGGDPRGYPFRLLTKKTGASNSFGGPEHGMGVPVPELRG